MTHTTQLNGDEQVVSCKTEDVSNFLIKNKDFFDKNPHVLAEIELQHVSGDAISLIERQISVLRAETKILRKQINSLVNIAKENDLLIQKIHALNVSLLQAPDIRQYMEIVHGQLETDFRADFVAIRFISNLLNIDETTVPVLDQNDQSFDLFENILNRGKPLCGGLNQHQLEILFEEDAVLVGSVALVPLFFGQALGLLAIGSRDKERFRAGTSTAFLAMLGEMAGLSLKRFVRVND